VTKVIDKETEEAEGKKEKKEKINRLKNPLVIKFKLTLLDEALGMTPCDPKAVEEYIAAKAPDGEKRKEEIEATPELTEEDAKISIPKTAFPKDADGNPFMWDYQGKGVLKDACGMLRIADGTVCSGLTAYKKKIDGLIFIKPRRIRLVMPDGVGYGECIRSLRVETMQGPRTCLARSETVPAGTYMIWEIHFLREDMVGMVKEVFDYGERRGFAQWRNSGKGIFKWEELS
jgi:hypothetical protein